MQQYNEDQERWKRKEAKQKIKEDRNKLARERYWRPKNIEKRRLARAERKRLKAERMQKMLADTFKIVNSMFK